MANKVFNELINKTKSAASNMFSGAISMSEYEQNMTPQEQMNYEENLILLESL